MSEDAVPLISHEELLRRLDDPTLTVLNVLPSEAHLEYFIPGTGNLPFAEIELKAASALPDKQAEIVVYCGKLD